MKIFTEFLLQLYSMVLFINADIKAYKKQDKSEIGSIGYHGKPGYCHFDNTTCAPIRRIRINLMPTAPVINRTSFSSIPSYKDIMTNRVLTKNKTICKNDADETLTKEDKSSLEKEENLEILLNEKEWKKNFASIECGAKLIKSSGNIKHPNHIINKNNDEYMLNECKEETFFIIELCETIKVIRFELDNFELYSGTPRNFTVRTIDKYNNNPNQWIAIGSFEASSEKMELQNFSNLEIKSFGKFIRVDINSFHGTEHFCTLTSFRVFGMTEYEYLDLKDEEESTPDVEEETIKIESVVDNRLKELEMRSEKNEALKDQTTMLSYKYLFLQMRNDVCVDSVHFEHFTKYGLNRNRENIQSIEYSTVEKKIIEPAQAKVTDTSPSIPKKVQNLTKLDGNGSVVTAPKESVLVQISNRLKILEKNFTMHNNILKSFNISSKQQANDINKILETILKAKEVFQESAGETDAVKSNVNDLSKKLTRFEKVLEENADSMKLLMALIILLSILSLFLISLVCFKPNEKDNEEPIEVELKIKKKDDKICVQNTQVQTDSPKIVKKVTFSDDEKDGKASDDDISAKLIFHQRVRRRDPKRRVTWCGGTFRKLAEEAKYMVKEF